MKALKKRNIMPRIILSSAKIHRPPGIIKTGAEAASGKAVVARLETLEKQLTEMMKMMMEMHQISQKLQTTSATQSTLSTMAPT